MWNKVKNRKKIMQITRISFLVAAIGFLLTVAADTDSTIFFEDEFAKMQPNSTVSLVCLRCMCECASACDLELQCDGNVCGPFKITKAFWVDSGRPTLKDETSSSPNAYEHCSNNFNCAVKSIQRYMWKFGQDCNGDGVVDCYDYAALHKLGGYGCKFGMPVAYKDQFDRCLKFLSNFPDI